MRVLQASGRREKRFEMTSVCFLRLRADGGYVSCQLINISNSGAKLTGFFPEKMPDRFILGLSMDGRVLRNCKLVWRKGEEIGVCFTPKPPF